MNWLNMESRLRVEEAFLVASDETLGVWWRLSMYCAAKENHGRIVSARDWPQRLWLASVGTDSDLLQTDSTLWKWDGDDLRVFFYPEDQQRLMAEKRSVGKASAHKRWLAEKKRKDGSPNGSAMGHPIRKDKGKGNCNDKNNHLAEQNGRYSRAGSQFPA